MGTKNLQVCLIKKKIIEIMVPQNKKGVTKGTQIC